VGEYTAEDRERDKRDVWVTAHDCLGLDLTTEQVDEILKDRHVGGLIMQWGVDTVSREEIANYIGKKVTGRRWPTYGDPQEAKNAFHAAFGTEVEAKGYKKVQT